MRSPLEIDETDVMNLLEESLYLLDENQDDESELEIESIKTFDEKGYLTRDKGFELRINGQIFLITIQEK